MGCENIIYIISYLHEHSINPSYLAVKTQQMPWVLSHGSYEHWSNAGIEHLIEREYLERDKDQVQQSLVKNGGEKAVSGGMNVCTTIQITICII